MIDLRTIDDITRKLSDSLPPGLSEAKKEVETSFQAVLSRAFEKMNLVSREEFDAQCAVLARTREKLEELEKRLES
jgi:BMFP domain-containing protein YqiC